MSSHRRKLLPLYIASLVSGQAAAVGLGEIQLHSVLGAPLEAVIPVNDIGDLGADQIKAQLGSQADYRAMGVDYSFQHGQLQIQPVVRDGRAYLHITTRDPVAEPYLDFVLNLHWPQGQVAREYTVLLDPPETALAAARQPAATEPRTAPVAAAAMPVPVRQHHRRQRAAPADGSYFTRRGDTLWQLADRWRPSGVPQQQMMNAILATNPQAFINGKPDLLKEAATIVVPGPEQIAAASGAALPVAEAPQRAAEPRVAAAPQPAVAAAPATAAAAPALAAENASLKTQVAELSADVAALNQHLDQSQQRLHQLEDQLDGLMQQMQQQRDATRALAAVGAPAADAAAAGTVISQVNAAELSAPPRAHTPWWVHLLYWLGIGAVSTWAIREHFWPRSRPAMAGATASPGPVRAAVMPASLPAPEPAPWAAATSDRYWQHRAADEELPLDLMDLEPEQPERPLQRAGGSAPEVPAAVHAADDPVDPSISAGVFVAFGRYREAEQVLQEALQHEPDRADLKLQLLDVYLQGDNAEAFEELAEAVERDHHDPEVLAELVVLRNNFHSHH